MLEQPIKSLESDKRDALEYLGAFIDEVLAGEKSLAEAQPELYFINCARNGLRLGEDALEGYDEQTKIAIHEGWTENLSRVVGSDQGTIVLQVVQRQGNTIGLHMVIHSSLQDLQEGNWFLQSLNLGLIEPGSDLPVYIWKKNRRIYTDGEKKWQDLLALDQFTNAFVEIMVKPSEEEGQVKSTQDTDFLKPSPNAATLSSRVFGDSESAFGPLKNKGHLEVTNYSRITSDNEMKIYKSIIRSLPANQDREVRIGIPTTLGYQAVEPKLNMATGELELVLYDLGYDPSKNLVRNGNTTRVIPVKVTNAEGGHVGWVLAHLVDDHYFKKPYVIFSGVQGIVSDIRAWEYEEAIRTALSRAQVASSSPLE